LKELIIRKKKSSKETKLIYKTGGISCNKRCITNEQSLEQSLSSIQQIKRIQELVNKVLVSLGVEI
jgi:hypothetical protein